MKLTAEIYRISDLSCDRTEEMYALMVRHYEHVARADFVSDLAEKDWVIQLVDSDDGTLQGFSTLMRYRHRYGGREIAVAFSGDTITSPAYWGGMQLPLAFGGLMFSLLDEDPNTPLYWFLISKGFRTYRFLPVYFHHFYPRFDADTPAWEKGLLDDLASTKFGQRYNAATGIIEAADAAPTLRPELTGNHTAERRRDPHIDFFLDRNPGHARGDELACIARFAAENLRPFVRRQLSRLGEPAFP